MLSETSDALYCTGRLPSLLVFLLSYELTCAVCALFSESASFYSSLPAKLHTVLNSIYFFPRSFLICVVEISGVLGR